MSPRGTAEILALAIVLVPGIAGASDLERLPGKKAVAPGLVPAPDGPPPLLLAWLDVSNVTVGVDGVARSEVRSILKGAGLTVAWRRGSGGEEARPGEIRIILVDRLLVEMDSGRPVLGATPTELREHPLVWIHVRSVRAALGLPTGSVAHGLPVSARRNLGVALGRVIAHEIVHALVPSLRHGGELMAEGLRRDQLTGPRLSVTPADALAVRGALDGSLTPPHGRAGVLAARGRSLTARTGFAAKRDPRTRSEAERDLAR